MAISPEIKSRISSAGESEYGVPPMATEGSVNVSDQADSNSNSSIGYIIAVLAVLTIGYFGYAYYWPVTNLPVLTNQTPFTVTRPVVPVPSADAPATKTVP